MILEFKINNSSYKIDIDKPCRISIPLEFHDGQPSAFGAPKATAEAVETGKFIGDTRRGGSCNFEQYTFIPHCNGTHTECVGHISHERISINDILKDSFIPSTLITVTPENAVVSNESYKPDKQDKDMFITRKALSDALQNSKPKFLEALIIRTLPNDDSKKTRDYMKNPPPFFSLEAMEYVSGLGVRHLLVDLPSLDRTFDEGLLSAHRIFWENIHSPKTVTEMIYVPDSIKNGLYVLNLQIADFVADASSSRPILFEIL
jgi:kynurenine formamidase